MCFWLVRLFKLKFNQIQTFPHIQEVVFPFPDEHIFYYRCNWFHEAAAPSSVLLPTASIWLNSIHLYNWSLLYIKTTKSLAVLKLNILYSDLKTLKTGIHNSSEGQELVRDKNKWGTRTMMSFTILDFGHHSGGRQRAGWRGINMNGMRNFKRRGTSQSNWVSFKDPTALDLTVMPSYTVSF